MIVLALDSTTRDGSVAVWRDGALRRVESGDAARGFSERLPGHVLSLLAAEGLAPADVDVFAVSAGPGSLTGLRVGLATIQGLAFAAGRPVVAVPTLELVARGAAAAAIAGGAGDIGACRDAARGEVFWARWRLDRSQGNDAGRIALDPVDNAMVLAPADLVGRWRALSPPQAVAGDGWPLCQEAAASHGVAPLLVETPPLAAPLAERAAVLALAKQTVSPHAVHPVYVRRPDAELARDRRAGTASPAR